MMECKYSDPGLGSSGGLLVVWVIKLTWFNKQETLIIYFENKGSSSVENELWYVFLQF